MQSVNFLTVPGIHYKPSLTRYSCPKMAKLKMVSFCEEILYLASKFYMHIFNMSVTCIQCFGKIQRKM